MSSLILEDGTPNRRHRKHLAQLLTKSTGIIRIATACVTERQLLSTATDREVRLLTSLAPMNVASGATSLESLNALLKMGVQCRALPPRSRFHAKVYIFGNSYAVVTSANLTNNGLDSNIEAGIETSGRETGSLVSWFDHLWKNAVTVTAPQLADLQRETSALRREFSNLKRSIKAKAKPTRTVTPNSTFSDSLEHLFQTAGRFFVCNTDRRQGDRTPTGGFVLEEEMHSRGFAAAWEDFKFPTHMEKVKRGDAIFMFAKGVGIVGIGVATGIYENIGPAQEGQVSDIHDTIEWRVPTQWLVWKDKSEAFRCKSPNRSLFTFWNVTESQYDGFRADVAAHFVGNE